jgi:hypothetical protein
MSPVNPQRRKVRKFHRSKMTVCGSAKPLQRRPGASLRHVSRRENPNARYVVRMGKEGGPCLAQRAGPAVFDGARGRDTSTPLPESGPITHPCRLEGLSMSGPPIMDTKHKGGPWIYVRQPVSEHAPPDRAIPQSPWPWPCQPMALSAKGIIIGRAHGARTPQNQIADRETLSSSHGESGNPPKTLSILAYSVNIRGLPWDGGPVQKQWLE